MIKIKFLRLGSSFACNSTDSCSKNIENSLGINIDCQNSLTKTLVLKKGYNYIDKSAFGMFSVSKLMIPLLSTGTVQISVDTSNGSQYSDYIYCSIYGNRFYRINTDLNWRFYVRVYYDYDLDSNKFQKKYSKFDSSFKMNGSFALLDSYQTYSTNKETILSKPSKYLNYLLCFKLKRINRIKHFFYF